MKQMSFSRVGRKLTALILALMMVVGVMPLSSAALSEADTAAGDVSTEDGGTSVSSIIPDTTDDAKVINHIDICVRVLTENILKDNIRVQNPVLTAYKATADGFETKGTEIPLKDGAIDDGTTDVALIQFLSTSRALTSYIDPNNTAAGGIELYYGDKLVVECDLVYFTLLGVSQTKHVQYAEVMSEELNACIFKYSGTDAFGYDMRVEEDMDPGKPEEDQYKNITVTKEWVGDTASDRPDSITVTLGRKIQKIGMIDDPWVVDLSYAYEITLTAADDTLDADTWQKTVSIPAGAYDNNGRWMSYAYFIKDCTEVMPEGYADKYTTTVDGFVVTNTFNGGGDDNVEDVVITKEWVGDKESNRPEQITVTLKRYIQYMGVIDKPWLTDTTYSKTVTMTKAANRVDGDTWRTTVEDAPTGAYDSLGVWMSYSYYVDSTSEILPEGYTNKYTTTVADMVNGEIVITNTYVADKSYNVTYRYLNSAPIGAEKAPIDENNPYKVGMTVTVKPTPADINGYKFYGWYDLKNITKEFLSNIDPDSWVLSDDLIDVLTKILEKNKVEGKFDMPARDVELVGIWLKHDDSSTNHTVVYQYVGGGTSTGHPEGKVAPVDGNSYAFGEQVTVLGTPADVEGWKFEGWYRDDVALKTYATGDTFPMPAHDVVMIGKWTKLDDGTHKVSYSHSYDTTDTYLTNRLPTLPDEKWYAPGATVTIAAAMTDVLGYSHTEWWMGGKQLAPGSTFVMPDNDVTLVCIWKTVEHKVYYMYAKNGQIPANADPVPVDSGKYKVHDWITVEALPADVEGYTFSGWTYAEVTYKEGDTFRYPALPDTNNVVLIGTWTKDEIIVPPVTDTDSITLKGQKNLTGSGKTNKDITANMFTFALTEYKSNDQTGYTGFTGKASMAAGGAITFDTLTFKKAGTYKFAATETGKSSAKYTYDQSVIVITIVTEADSNGNITIKSVTYAKNGTKVNGITFNNIYKNSTIIVIPTEHVVSKVWNDSNNAAGIRPATVTVEILRNGAHYDTVVLSAANNWKYTFNYLWDGTAFTLQEIDVPAGYVASYNANTLTVTNTYVAPQLNKNDHYAYIIGYPDGTIKPNDDITRAEAATIFFRLMTDTSRTAYMSTSNSYSDVNAGDWCNTAISTLAKAGILKAFTGSEFKPDQYITRAELSTMAAYFSNFADTNYESGFSDIEGHWAKMYIEFAAEHGWLYGYGDGTVKPDSNITRAETMALINRVLERAVEKSGLLEDIIVWPDNPTTAWYYEDVIEATNSHTYTRGNVNVPAHDFKYEIWKELLENRDWAALELGK